MDIRNGSSIALWYSFLSFVLRTSQIRIAIAMPTTMFTIINATLYSSVLRVMIHASGELNRNLKFSNPAHGLPRIPLAKFSFLKAMMMPAMGI